MADGLFAEPAWFRRFWNSFGKRLLDLIISTAGIAVSIPVWMIAVTAIRHDSPGPVFYCQRRLGKDGKPFRLYKLRTMINNAEETTGAVWSTEEDHRVTRVGRFLRRWHLDETPQFINVFLGDMSVIGPRPEREEIIKRIENMVPHYRKRLRIRPGITGLSQVRQSYDSCIRDVQRKIRYDILYTRKMCAYLDLKILYLTAIWVMHRKGH